MTSQKYLEVHSDLVCDAIYNVSMPFSPTNRYLDTDSDLFLISRDIDMFDQKEDIYISHIFFK